MKKRIITFVRTAMLLAADQHHGHIDVETLELLGQYLALGRDEQRVDLTLKAFEVLVCEPSFTPLAQRRLQRLQAGVHALDGGVRSTDVKHSHWGSPPILERVATPIIPEVHCPIFFPTRAHSHRDRRPPDKLSPRGITHVLDSTQNSNAIDRLRSTPQVSSRSTPYGNERHNRAARARVRDR